MGMWAGMQDLAARVFDCCVCPETKIVSLKQVKNPPVRYKRVKQTVSIKKDALDQSRNNWIRMKAEELMSTRDYTEDNLIQILTVVARKLGLFLVKSSTLALTIPLSVALRDHVGIKDMNRSAIANLQLP